GKTTLLRIIGLIESPTSGLVIFNDEIIDYGRDNLNLRRKIGLVFQQPILFNMSVFNNIAYPLKVRGYDRNLIRNKVEEVMKLLKIENLGEKNALGLSGGEAQRVALAQSLVYEPNLLLLDEPTSNLDPRNASIIEEVLLRINDERNTTIIMSTHNISQVEKLADRIAVLNMGKIERIGSFNEIFNKSNIPIFSRGENVFHGISRISPYGTSIIDIGGLQIEATFKKEGYVTIFIPPEDIILSLNPIISSARNSLEGRIVQIIDMGSLVRIKVNSIRDFYVQITRKSLEDMNLKVGERIFLAFKASSVQLLE
ncbi:MAG: ATP-binding cassette domain-containing protein, partial [Candidatus Methanomethyliaceae archaeon]|nr:ATP-binding cassette domain-containing protein [Candidatus Methanomethyliaceae archaeon]